MTEPRRLRDDAESAVELMLLEAGASYRSSENARAKTLAALGLATSAAATAGAVGVASTGLFGKLGWSKVLVISGIGAGLAAPVGYVAWQRAHEQPAPPAQSAPVHLAPAPLPAPTLEPVPTAEKMPEIVTLAPAPKPAEPRMSAQGALAAELGALDAARGKLADGDASGALAKLDDYSRAFPHGRLVLEAEVLRIDALQRAGQTDQAKKRAEAFLRRHPNSVLASRVRGYL